MKHNLIRIYLGKEQVGKVHLTDGFCVFNKEYRVETEYNMAVEVMESWDSMKERIDSNLKECYRPQAEDNQPKCDHVFGKIAICIEDEMHIHNMRLSNENYIKMARDPFFSNVISLLKHCSECGENINLPS